MPATRVAPKVLSWASEIDDETVVQAARASRLSIVPRHVALMSDAHVGIGATVGSVIPTKGAIIPAAVGVDIGCGMIASETDLTASDLPDDLTGLLRLIEARVPAGVGKGHHSIGLGAGKALDALGLPDGTTLDAKQRATAEAQFGSLGSGNHFVEVCLDERDVVWTVLHSGSRGIGNQLAQHHIAEAKTFAHHLNERLEDRNLAYLIEGTDQFKRYIADMLWSQDYAASSRELMNRAATRSLFEVAGKGRVKTVVNCHHNFTDLEEHNGEWLWITRKGAIKATAGKAGVIPGSMGTKSFIVSGKGNADSYNSCSHGAGRRLSRGQARRTLSVADFEAQMAGRTWQQDKAQTLLDEAPDAYKDIDVVMADQHDLVTVEHTLRQVLNFKGA